ncbi:DUF5133 domain-containing protein [Streptomyces sp. NPDC059740]|uniref:DUF5133 domain-containing protein n=1 Tax=Streptomyces sp. NPDC059740 TaxID=3346926 RepID=UPI003668F265
MLLPAEKRLRTALARFAEVRFAHDLHPTEQTAHALAEASHDLCVMTGTPTVDRALAVADDLLRTYCADRQESTRPGEPLAA